MDKILYGSWIKRDKPIGAKVNNNFLLQFKLQFELNPNDDIRNFYTVPISIDNSVKDYQFIYKEDL
ncbi:hypothetical protein P5E90_11995 [Clostridium perfringens]|jgi:hypothetical protein|uniref:Uncharacterized protein n=1 Tax=Clostridium perfringens TaxID=1502 RepID=A0AAW4IY38_CLOPF|nr:hypothetical protein [Clostridium perfringens]MBO3356121.1 hypothetical protein [Clostridium perfringens]MBO3359538.1 hypothetical protein [Clostridium perfringens]MDK0621555.1 hypothetical protein [Clostridium perfringens]